MLLITEQNVTQKRTVRGKKSASNLQTLGMPVFTLFTFTLRFIGRVLSKLNNEPDLCRYAEVANTQETNLLKERGPIQLTLILALREHIFKRYRVDLHDVTNVEISDQF